MPPRRECSPDRESWELEIVRTSLPRVRLWLHDLSMTCATDKTSYARTCQTGAFKLSGREVARSTQGEKLSISSSFRPGTKDRHQVQHSVAAAGIRLVPRNRVVFTCPDRFFWAG